MKLTLNDIQMMVLSVIALLVTLGSLLYVTLNAPDSLRKDKDGIPFFTSKVINPDTGEAMSISSLLAHYKEGMK